MGSLQGKVALVTGARGGIGRDICLALAGEGADFAVNDVEGAEQAEEVAQEIRDLGRRALFAMADVASPNRFMLWWIRSSANWAGWICW